MYSERLSTTLIDLIRIPSTSGHEEKIREHQYRHRNGAGTPRVTPMRIENPSGKK